MLLSTQTATMTTIGNNLVLFLAYCDAFNNIIDIVHRPFGFTCYWFSAASDLLRCWWCYSPRPVLSASLWKLELRDLLGNGLLEWLCVSGMAVLLVDKLGSLREVVWNGHLVGYLGNPEMILWGESLDRQIDSPPWPAQKQKIETHMTEWRRFDAASVEEGA